MKTDQECTFFNLNAYCLFQFHLSHLRIHRAIVVKFYYICWTSVPEQSVIVFETADNSKSGILSKSRHIFENSLRQIDIYGSAQKNMMVDGCLKWRNIKNCQFLTEYYYLMC